MDWQSANTLGALNGLNWLSETIPTVTYAFHQVLSEVLPKAPKALIKKVLTTRWQQVSVN